MNRAAALSDGVVVLAEELACRQGACLSAELFRLQDGASPIGGLAVGRMITPTVRVAPPPVEPPAVRSRFQGLRVVPETGLVVSPFQPNSGELVLPSITEPASLTRSTKTASLSGIQFS